DLPPAESGRTAPGPVRGVDQRGGGAVDPRGAPRDGAVRLEIPPERVPGPAHAPSRPVEAHAALAPAAPRQVPAPGRTAVPRRPDRGGDVPRVPRRRPRPAAVARVPQRDRAGDDPG